MHITPAGPEPGAAAGREWLQQQRQQLDARLGTRAPMRELLAGQSRLIDTLLKHTLRQHESALHELTLVPTGGYGRGELFPGSDVDLLLLHRRHISATTARAVEALLTELWDAGLRVGHAVRTVADCVQLARADVSEATALMEGRRLAGDPALYQQLRTALTPGRIWTLPRYLSAKRAEQAARHARHNSTDHNLEPNVKDGPGGLRDVQTLAWLTLHCYGSAELQELIRHDLLEPEEYHRLHASHELICRLRYLLHTLTGYREDRLRFDLQPGIAEQLGHPGHNNAAVQQCMHAYYRAAGCIQLSNELLLQRFAEGPAQRRWLRRRRINARFHAVGQRLQSTATSPFRTPRELLEPFRLLQQQEQLQGLRAETLRRLRAALPTATSGFPDNAADADAFLELLRRPQAGRLLRLMHRYGLLSALLPAFARINGLMQFDMFHVYTVDEHTLCVLERIDELQAAPQAEYPQCYQALGQLAHIELLRLAALFHDIAKGRGGDHSRLGAAEARHFCNQLGLSNYDTTLVAWLVRHHLTMSHTAMRKDLGDQAAIRKFAARIGNPERLHYLYLLTVADISGTNPAMWNGWKAHLLESLYLQTLQVLRLNPQDPQQAQHVRREAEALLARQSAAPARLLWNDPGTEYFTRYRPEEIAWHAVEVANHDPAGPPLVAACPHPLRGCTEIFIYMPDQDHIFSATTRVLDQLNLSVQDARILTGENGYTLDSYSVLEVNGKPVQEDWRRQEIVAALRTALVAPDTRLDVNRREHYKRDTRVATRVAFLQDTTQTTLQVIAADRRGLLCRVGATLTACGVRIHGARIATFGNRVEDLFFISDHHNQPLDDHHTRCQLQTAILAALEPPQ